MNVHLIIDFAFLCGQFSQSIASFFALLLHHYGEEEST